MAGTAVKAVGIVLIALVVGAASCVMVLLLILGLFGSHSREDQQAAMIVVAVYVVILSAGVTGMVLLGRSIRRQHQGPATTADLPAVMDEAAATRATADLRLALQAVLGVSVFMMLLRFAVHAMPAEMWRATLLNLVLYLWPYGLVWWRERDRPDRFGAILAICFAATSVVSSLLNIATVITNSLRFSSFRLGQWFWLGWAVAILTDAAVVWFAWRLCRVTPRAREEEMYIIGSLIGSIAYLGVLHFAGSLLFQYVR